MTNRKYDIHDRIFDFIVKVIKFIEPLSKTSVNKIITYQILKSVTSMGANDQEADGAPTKKEFIHRYGIVRKEGKETCFWLRLIGAINTTKRIGAMKLRDEGEEIVAIVSKIISNAKMTSRREKNDICHWIIRNWYLLVVIDFDCYG